MGRGGPEKRALGAQHGLLGTHVSTVTQRAREALGTHADVVAGTVDAAAAVLAGVGLTFVDVMLTQRACRQRDRRQCTLFYLY